VAIAPSMYTPELCFPPFCLLIVIKVLQFFTNYFSFLFYFSIVENNTAAKGNPPTICENTASDNKIEIPEKFDLT